MKSTHTQGEDAPSTLLGEIAPALLFIILCAVAAWVMSGCKPGWNAPHKINSSKEFPCGTTGEYFVCGDICCGEGSVCRPGYCAFVGGDRTRWGSSRDGGAAGDSGTELLAPSFTPQQVHDVETLQR